MSTGPVPRLLRLARSNLLAVVLAVTTMASVATAVGFGVAWSSEHAVFRQEAQVRAASSGFLLALTNFDPGTIDADFSRITGDATGAFSQQAQQFFGTKIRQELETARAGSRGEVRHLFIESISARSATVYAVVDQTYANAKMSTPNADVLRVVLQLVEAPGSSRWKVSGVTVLQPPSVYSGSQPTAPGSAGALG